MIYGNQDEFEDICLWAGIIKNITLRFRRFVRKVITLKQLSRTMRKSRYSICENLNWQ